MSGTHGTRVVVRDLFGNIAVRVKQRAIHFESVDHVAREFDRLKLQIAAVALAWPKPVRIIVSGQQPRERRKFAIGTQTKATDSDNHEAITLQKVPDFRLDHICTVLSHAGYITHTDFESWTSVSARTSQIFVRAAICLQPAPSKQLQFISLGIHPLDKASTLSQTLYREVNTLFAESAFGTVEEDLDLHEEEHLRRLKDRRYKKDGHTDRQLKGRGKGADRWPMFYVRIDSRDNDVPAGVLRSDEDDRQAAKYLEKTVQLISTMIQQFLQERHFRPRAKRYPSRLHINDKRGCANGTSSEPLKEIRNLAQSAEGRHQMPGFELKQMNPVVVNLASIGGQRHAQKFASAPPFSSWSRIKSGKPHGAEDLLSGLPRSRPTHVLQRNYSGPVTYNEDIGPCARNRMLQGCVTKEHSNEDVQLLLRALSEDSDKENGNHESTSEQKAQIACQSRDQDHDGDITTLKQHDSEDGVIVWRNPVSSEEIQINSRTGSSLPAFWPPSRPQSSISGQRARLERDIRGPLRNPNIGPRKSDLCMETQHKPKSWLGSLLTDWQSPVFSLKERPIPSVVPEHDETAHAEAHKYCHSKYDQNVEPETIGRKGRLSKAALENANILGQVDKKFILASMKRLGSQERSKTFSNSDNTALVLIDQHAADERCRVEELYAEISRNNPGKMALLKPVIFEVTAQESEIFRRERTYFEAWEIRYEVRAEENAGKKNVHGGRPVSAPLHSVDVQVDKLYGRPATATASFPSAAFPDHKAAMPLGFQVVVHALPELIGERCRLDPQLLIDFLRKEVWARTQSSPRPLTPDSVDEDWRIHAEEGPSSHVWLKRISSCPRGIIDLLNSRACRSAIMFNDELTKPECVVLVKKLAKCAFPFQCAHGRPSMAVLGAFDLGVAQFPSNTVADAGERVGPTDLTGEGEGESINQNFLRVFATWQQQTNH